MDDEKNFPGDHRLAGYEEQIDQLRECGRLFHSRAWSVGTSSNYSVVIPGEPHELIVTASGKDKGRLGREDFVRLNAEGLPTIENQPASSAETMLHVVLAADPVAAGSILHTHSVWGTLLSDRFFTDGGLRSVAMRCSKGWRGPKPIKRHIGFPSSITPKTSQPLRQKFARCSNQSRRR